MEPFRCLKSKAVPLDISNIDTDQIIPKQFLKLLGKTGYGKYLFYDWRYDRDGNDVPSFALNSPEYKGRKILLTRENFGIGSSREHAVWAIKDYGFKAILGTSFADIFYNNCFKNGILAVKLDRSKIDRIFSSAADEDIEIDLSSQTVKTGLETCRFDIDSTLRHNLLEGIDEVSMTLKFEDRIKKYELDNNALVFP